MRRFFGLLYPRTGFASKVHVTLKACEFFGLAALPELVEGTAAGPFDRLKERRPGISSQPLSGAKGLEWWVHSVPPLHQILQSCLPDRQALRSFRITFWGKASRTRRRIPRHVPLWTILIAVLLLAGGCQPGTYPLDYFPEMHYQASFRAQEPPRKYPHPEAVPITGKAIQYDAGQLLALPNPYPRTPANLDRGKVLFQTNCSMCHGPQGRGDGLIAAKFKNANASTLPANLSDPVTQNKPDGQLWGIITNGGLNMPKFQNLLTEEERWLLVHFIKSLRGFAQEVSK